MKMEEAVGKVEELTESAAPPKASEQETVKEEDGSVELESQVPKDGGAGSTVLSSMPCLLMELRRDSSESQLASTESDKPTTGRVYESDSSNHCMLSPSSSGHLADSDTLSSVEENEPSQAETTVEGDTSGVPGATVGRKSRRSRSESETSTMAAKKNRQSSDKQNGRVTKVKGHRSQKHKERIRLLRQKREAAARKKYSLLQDSSTSDSDLTCDSSTSSSDDEEEVSGSSKTITAEIPDGPPVVAHYDMSDTSSDPEVINVDNLLAAAVVQEHSNSVGGQDTGATWRTSELLEAGHLDPGFLASDKTSVGSAPLNEEINIASSDSEVEIVGVQEHASIREWTWVMSPPEIRSPCVSSHLTATCSEEVDRYQELRTITEQVGNTSGLSPGSVGHLKHFGLTVMTASFTWKLVGIEVQDGYIHTLAARPAPWFSSK